MTTWKKQRAAGDDALQLSKCDNGSRECDRTDQNTKINFNQVNSFFNTLVLMSRLNVICDTDQYSGHADKTV